MQTGFQLREQSPRGVTVHLACAEQCVADGAEHLHSSVGPNLGPETWAGDPELTEG